MTHENDPIEGFQLVNYDDEMKEATVAVDSALLALASQREALAEKAKQIILRDHGKTVHSVLFVERPGV